MPPDPAAASEKAETRREVFGLVSLALGARGDLSAEDQKRMNEVAQLFGVDAGSAAANLALLPSARTQVQAKAS